MKFYVQVLVVLGVWQAAFFGPSTFYSYKGKEKKAMVQVSLQFKGIEEGYDHESKAVVYLGNTQFYESKPGLQSKEKKFTLEIPYGNQDIKILIFAKYKGEWEAHLKENNYSIDCLVESNFKIKKKKHNLSVVFDLDDKTKYTFK